MNNLVGQVWRFSGDIMTCTELSRKKKWLAWHRCDTKRDRNESVQILISFLETQLNRVRSHRIDLSY